MDRFQLILGDCLEKMQDIPSGTVDMILSDLPYGVLNRGNESARWDQRLPLDRLWEQYERVVKPSGAAVLFGQGQFTAQLMQSNPKLWRYNLVWDKVLVGGFLNAKKMPLRRHEDILVFYRKLPTYSPQMTVGAPLHARGGLTRVPELRTDATALSRPPMIPARDVVKSTLHRYLGLQNPTQAYRNTLPKSP